MKILVVHRQKEVPDQIKSVLQSTSIVIRFTDSGLDGLLAARIESFDLIICGTDLPVVTGFELIRSMRSNSLNKNTTVIFLSDEVNSKTKLLADALGVIGMMAIHEMDNQLASLVSEQVTVGPNRNWNNFLSETRLN